MSYSMVCAADLCLDHLHALASQVLEEVEDTESPLPLDLLHH